MAGHRRNSITITRLPQGESEVIPTASVWTKVTHLEAQWLVPTTLQLVSRRARAKPHLTPQDYHSPPHPHQGRLDPQMPRRQLCSLRRWAPRLPGCLPGASSGNVCHRGMDQLCPCTGWVTLARGTPREHLSQRDRPCVSMHRLSDLLPGVSPGNVSDSRTDNL